MKIFFDHEKLLAYQESLNFAAWCRPILDALPKSYAVRDQLDRARTSAPLNIAEGNAKYTAPDRCRFLDTARGSAVECAACLDLLRIDGHITEGQVEAGKAILLKIVSLLVGLIKSNNPNRFGEEPGEYRVSMQMKEQE